MIIYCFLFIALIILFLLIANEYYIRVVQYHSQWNFINRGKEGGPYDAISFGSAYCRYGIDFGNYNGYNFGYGSQFFYYTDKMLREYAPRCLKQGGVVYLIIADLVFAETGKGMYGADQYIKILSRNSLQDEFSLINYLKIYRLPLLFHPRLIKNCLYCIIKGCNNEYTNTLVNKFNEQDIKKAALQRCKDWCDQFGLENTISSTISTELEQKFSQSRDILSSMIEFCINQGFKPILVITPVSGIMNSYLSEEFVKAVLYNNIEKANTHKVPLVNYLRDPEFADFRLYHNNADFLNARGRRLFTEKLLKDTGLL